MKKVMLIGYGAMAQAVIERLPPQVRVEWIVARESHHAAICLQFGQAVTPLTDPLQCGGTPDLVLECASQQAVAQYGEAVLARGWRSGGDLDRCVGGQTNWNSVYVRRAAS